MFTVLFDRHAQKIANYVAFLTKSRSDVDDLVQDTFIKVFQAIGNYKPHGKFISWIFVVSRNIVRDWQRRGKNKASVPIDTLPLSKMPATKDSTAEPSTKEELLASCNDREREILLLRYVEGLSYEEISEIMGLSNGSLRNIVSQTVKRLSEEE
ncbi:MAG: RNA polymerase sigma factor [Candidatus Riflebacteria bacterium]|nr:RNA polymerase sigma factor [Candidatus Riflebacteria bacterium]